VSIDAALTWWRARPLREQLLIGAGITAALLAAGDALITAPLEKRLKRSSQEAQALSAQLLKLRPSAEAESLREQETALRSRLERARAESTTFRRELAEATRLPEALRAITATVGSARLLELDLSGDAEAGSAGDAGKPGAKRLYRLPITMKVSGDWAELQLLLSQVERHASALHWTALVLDNSEWPAIQLTLKAHVLSTEARWGAAS
jgi:hypothetical protein